MFLYSDVVALRDCISNTIITVMNSIWTLEIELLPVQVPLTTFVDYIGRIRSVGINDDIVIDSRLRHPSSPSFLSSFYLAFCTAPFP